jgi:uncharacterized protein YecE (DUF72 family)
MGPHARMRHDPSGDRNPLPVSGELQADTLQNIDAMNEFFTSIDRPSGVRLFWEPRGPWPDEIVRSVCETQRLIHAVDPFVRPSLTPELLYWRLHGNRSHYARYTDDELRQILDWLPPEGTEAYVLFNNIPRVADVSRFRELGSTRAIYCAVPHLD